MCCGSDTRYKTSLNLREDFEIDNGHRNQAMRYRESLSTAQIAVRHRSRSKNESNHANKNMRSQSLNKNISSLTKKEKQVLQNLQQGKNLQQPSKQELNELHQFEMSSVNAQFYTDNQNSLNQTVETHHQNSSQNMMLNKKGSQQVLHNQKINNQQIEIIQEQPLVESRYSKIKKDFRISQKYYYSHKSSHDNTQMEVDAI